MGHYFQIKLACYRYERKSNKRKEITINMDPKINIEIDKDSLADFLYFLVNPGKTPLVFLNIHKPIVKEIVEELGYTVKEWGGYFNFSGEYFTQYKFKASNREHNLFTDFIDELFNGSRYRITNLTIDKNYELPNFIVNLEIQEKNLQDVK